MIQQLDIAFWAEVGLVEDMEIFIHLSQSSKEPSQDSFGTGIPLLQDRLHTASCTKGTGFSLWDSSKLQFSYDRLFLGIG